MQRTIRIERLPKLDKVLRITFASIKKDFIETREEFNQLEEKVDTSLDIFGKRLNDASNTAFSELKNRSDTADKKIDSRTAEIELQVRELSANVEKFVSAINSKIIEWNAKIRRLDENSAKAAEIGAELKKIAFLRQELERIPVIAGQAKSVEAVAVPRSEFKKEIAEIDKKIEKSTGRLKDSQEMARVRLDKTISEAKNELNSRDSILDEKIKAVSKELKDATALLRQEIAKKPWEKEIADAAGHLKHEIFAEAKKRADEFEKHTARDKEAMLKISEDHKKLKDAKPKKEQKEDKKEEKKSIFRRVLDFLIEDVEEGKDKTLHEFDKKKGDRFEIKELDDWEKMNK